MNPIFAAALEIQAFCQERTWPFCIIGGLAAARWGEPRFTRDVDCTIVAGRAHEDECIDALLGRFAARIEDARTFAMANRVVLIVSAGAVPIDVALGGIEYEERMIARASPYRLDATATLTTCSAEDLIVLKAFAGRDHDWVDIAGILQRQAGRLDEGLVWRELEPLLQLKEEPSAEAAEKLRRLLRRADG